MAKFKVVITARSFGKADDMAYDCLREAGCQWVKLETEKEIEERLGEELRGADALIAGLELLDRRRIEGAPRLKVISRYGVGYDKVDLAAARERGIQVTITPGANSDSVADLAVALMLDVSRNISLMDSAVKAKKQRRPQGLEMCGKTLGVVGTGRIGQGVARRCKGFDMKILAYDICEDRDFQNETGARYVDLETLLRDSDYISLHSPLTEETKNLIASRELRMMKKDAVLINTARGGLIDEAALYEALKEGLIRGAALDATMDEPPYDSPLLTCENCILTPHAGAATREASSRMSLMAAQNAVEALLGKECWFNVAK